MTFPVTSLYAIPLVLIFLALWFNVSSKRSALKVSIGDAGDVDLHERIRKHGNFVEWVPMVLILMILAEGQGADAIYIHASGVLLVLGRLVHPFGLNAENPMAFLRIVGNSTNILATLIAVVCLVIKSLGY